VLGVLLQRVVDLAVERYRGRLGEVVVERPFARLVLDGARVFLVEVLDRGADALALFLEQLLELGRFERTHEPPAR
jgi:hypothetical protein